MFKLTLITTILLFLNFCGPKEEAPKEEPKEVKTTTTTTDSGLDSKIKAYEDFVTKFCALTDKMKGASATEKITLATDFKNDTANLKTLQTDLEALKATASDEQKKKMEAAAKKATGCAANAAGASTPTLPKTPELPKTPKIPGM
jgi:hypothetical protein